MRGHSPGCVLIACWLCLLLYGARAGGQGLPDRPVGLPAIDRGLVERVYSAPDSPEAKVRESIRALNGPAERVGASGAPYLAGRLIVKFKEGASPATRMSVMSAVRGAPMGQPGSADFDVVAIDPSQDAEAAARIMAARPAVEYAQPAYRIHPRFRPNDTYYSRQWNLPDIDMERAWDVQPSAGSTITVAVLDSGIAYTNTIRSYHAGAFSVNSDREVFPGGASGTRYPALGDLTFTFVAAPDLGPEARFVSPHDFIWDTTVPVDLSGHGTHVAGTIGQRTNNGEGVAGVAFDVKIMPVKVIDTEWDVIFGAPVVGTDDVVARGIRYAADNGARVINLSIGRTGPAGSAPVIEDAISFQNPVRFLGIFVLAHLVIRRHAGPPITAIMKD